VFPRFIFDHFTDRDIKLLLSDAHERTKVNEVLIKCCKDNGFDGLVLEVWSQLAGRIDDKILYALVLQMGGFNELNNVLIIIKLSSACSQGTSETAAAPHPSYSPISQGYGTSFRREAHGQAV